MTKMVFAKAGKKGTREAVKKIRDSMPAGEVEQKSAAIAAKLQQLEEYAGAKTVLFYAAKGNEAQTRDIIEAALKAGKKVLLPITDLKNKKIEIAAIDDYGKDLRKGAFGIMEPKQKKAFDEARIDAVVVPGLAFDERGHRLGYGHGFYDKLLKMLNAVKIGLAYDFQIIKRLPAEGHDQRMDLIATESRVIRCR